MNLLLEINPKETLDFLSALTYTHKNIVLYTHQRKKTEDFFIFGLFSVLTYGLKKRFGHQLYSEPEAI